MSEELYQEAILAHAKAAVRAGRLGAPHASATAYNPLCGDRVTIELRLDQGRLSDIAQEVKGCALCRAAASLLAASAVGAEPGALKTSARVFERMIRENGPPPDGPWAEFAVFTPVQRHKSRHDCVLLPFDALAEALDRAAGPSPSS